ncbi:MAG: hypothetical protein LR017_04010, partial [Candidatus Pacebacteria bacterium]|nr:hypothetical protein [Candidatus Paceibacterota bacterium]
SLDSGSDYKNDYSGYFHKRQITSETVEFVLIDMSDGTEYILNSNDYGTFKGFGTIPDAPQLSTFILDWKKVLVDLGEGAYKVIKRINVVGIAVIHEYLVYDLYNYSTSRADKTVRIDVTMEGLLEKQDIDFTGSEFKTTLRLPGFFGRREPKWEEDNLIDRSYNKRQISMKQTNEYKFQTNMIPDCLTFEIFDFMLFSDNIRMNDYNLNNHTYSFVNFPVKLANNEGTGYASTTRKAIVNLVFTDKTVNNNKRNY